MLALNSPKQETNIASTRQRQTETSHSVVSRHKDMSQL